MIEVFRTVFVIMLYTLGILMLGFFSLVLYALIYNVYDKGIRPTPADLSKDDHHEQI